MVDAIKSKRNMDVNNFPFARYARNIIYAWYILTTQSSCQSTLLSPKNALHLEK